MACGIHFFSNFVCWSFAMFSFRIRLPIPTAFAAGILRQQKKTKASDPYLYIFCAAYRHSKGIYLHLCEFHSMNLFSILYVSCWSGFYFCSDGMTHGMPRQDTDRLIYIPFAHIRCVTMYTKNIQRHIDILTKRWIKPERNVERVGEWARLFPRRKTKYFESERARACLKQSKKI